ncbi:MAG: aspartate kinase, partial [Eudoraea sp.]|nr:aspartate kinase [Eudoraea sp.]
KILDDLFAPGHSIFSEIEARFDQMHATLKTHSNAQYNFLYDQVVSFGELLSSQIISAYLNQEGVQNTWLDIREIIETDQNYRDARVDWEKTVGNISRLIEPSELYTTQGFIGADPEGFTTTLGREGSDYTAAILAYGLNADSVTIWKDVPGVLNADPRYFEETQLLHHISYREAIELAFYGASVIHPKTLQPLQRKEIPLRVKSFIQPANDGTTVGKGVLLDPVTPCFILKKDQVLLKLSTLDFSFIVEHNISAIFKTLHDHRIKVELMQNSAISISMCLDTTFGNLPSLLEELEKEYKIEFFEGVDLYTIRHFDEESIKKIVNTRPVILEQRGRETVQLIVRADAG